MIKIATLYTDGYSPNFKPYKMSTLRWLKISESLARLGFKVDMIVSDGREAVVRNRNLRYLPCRMVRWEEYDIVKTLFHKGFQFLSSHNGDNHPFILSKLGSVVGNKDRTEGVYFYKNAWEELYLVQKEIARKSRYVSILTEPSRDLWLRQFSRKNNVLLVPTGVDREIPPPARNPYGAFKEKIVIYAGTIYERASRQREVNLKWQRRLNLLGSLLKKRGIRLCLVGLGDRDKLDPESVTFMGAVENDRFWDYQYFADAGIVLAQGKVQHNESSKIYHYLRTGLPVVSEGPVPNNNIICEAGLGFIAGFNDNETMAEMIEEAVYRKWDRRAAIDYMVKNHTWDIRAQTYYRLIKRKFPGKMPDLPDLAKGKR